MTMTSGSVIAAIRERFPPQGQVKASIRYTLFRSSAHFALGLRGRGFGGDGRCGVLSKRTWLVVLEGWRRWFWIWQWSGVWRLL